MLSNQLEPFSGPSHFGPKISKNYSTNFLSKDNQSIFEEDSKVKKDVLIKEVLRDLKVRLRDNFHIV
jgi:hypothetical protein